MKKGFKILLFVIAFGLVIGLNQAVKAQCAICAANVASNTKNGGNAADGLNHGIMYLMAAPYLVVAILAYVWYKKYRKKDVDINMPKERLNLN
jgi:hypothetical protein